MVFYFASPKYNPLINKVLTETDQVIAESIVGNDLFLKKTMKDKSGQYCVNRHYNC